jgi:short-subunit dehydrogenase
MAAVRELSELHMSYKDKVVIITGGSKRIGKGYVEATSLSMTLVSRAYRDITTS